MSCACTKAGRPTPADLKHVLEHMLADGLIERDVAADVWGQLSIVYTPTPSRLES